MADRLIFLRGWFANTTEGISFVPFVLFASFVVTDRLFHHEGPERPARDRD